MTTDKWTIDKLAFLREDGEPSQLNFPKPVNLIYGASNTGKSFAVKVIDFLLGAGIELPDIAERRPYQSARLEMSFSPNESAIFERALAGGALALAHSDREREILSARHNADNFDNISNLLLKHLDATGKKISKDKHHTKINLSFRHIAHLCITDETRIQSETSPVETGSRDSATSERSAFKFLLTGVDDSAVQTELNRISAETVHIIRAPIDGRITGLQARKGEQASNGISLGVILPEASQLIAEIYLPSRAIGFVEVGQRVKLQYDAFPYQKFGIAFGEIRQVASTAQLPQEIGIPSQTGEPVYRVGIELSSQSVKAFSRAHPLQAGMELTADIVLEDRRLLEWLLEPLKR